MIDAEKIKQLKEKTSLVELFKSYGHIPKKKGNVYKVCCPFHDDKEPSLSINLKTNLWQCFGCGAAGDAISLVMKLEKITFLSAVNKLAKQEKIAIGSWPLAFSSSSLPKANSQQPTANNRAKHELMNKIAAFYHRVFMEKPDGKEYLKKRGITDERLFKEHQIGYVDGTLLTATPKDLIPQLIELGLLLENGKERFLNCVVFPLWSVVSGQWSVVGFYGRHVNTGHFYMPGQRCGIFNLQKGTEAHRHRGTELIITESVIDALSFINKGFNNVLPIYGTNGFTSDHSKLLNDLKPEKIIIALDGDEQGKKAAAQLKEKQLSSFNCEIVTFPENQDANEYFLSHSKSDFEKTFIVDRLSLIDQQTKRQKDQQTKYQLKHIEQKKGKLTVTLKVDNPQTKRFVLDTVNLYSQKQRDGLIKSVSELFGEDQEVIEREVTDLIQVAEDKASQLSVAGGQLSEEDQKEEKISAEDEQEALAFLKNPKLFDGIIKDYETLGYIGEESNKKLAYLVMTSRKLANPLSLIIVSNSAAGKSSLQEATMEFCPPEDGKHFTRLTQQSLYYLGEESLKHKFLSIEEEEGSSEASYSLKTLLSAKQLKVVSTTQDPVTGKKRADEYKTEGPVAVMVSTTKPDIEPEFCSRALIMAVDESQQQTQDIHSQQKHVRTKEGRIVQAKKEAAIRKQQNAQRLLDQSLVVVNNYAPQLTFPIHRLRYRRSHAQYLDLIESVAFLSQHQKAVKEEKNLGRYIEVDKTDIAIANDIFKEVIGWTLQEMKPPTRGVLKTIVEHCGESRNKVFQRRHIMEKGHYSRVHLHRHLKILEELEYITLETGANGTKYTYKLIYEGNLELEEKFVLGLKDVKDLKEV
jgi:DNA primase